MCFSSSASFVVAAALLPLGVASVRYCREQQRSELLQVGAEIEDCQTELWLLTHTEARHLRRVAAVYRHLSEQLVLV